MASRTKLCGAMLLFLCLNIVPGKSPASLGIKSRALATADGDTCQTSSSARDTCCWANAENFIRIFGLREGASLLLDRSVNVGRWRVGQHRAGVRESPCISTALGAKKRGGDGAKKPSKV